MTKNISLHNFSNDWWVLVVWFSQKNVLSWRFSSKSKGSESVHDKVDPKHLNCIQWGTLQNNRAEEHNEHSNDIDRQLELKELPDVVINISSVSEGNNNRTEVIIHQNDVWSSFCNICSSDSHCETNISLWQSWCIIRSISSNSNDSITLLDTCDKE